MSSSCKTGGNKNLSKKKGGEVPAVEADKKSWLSLPSWLNFSSQPAPAPAPAPPAQPPAQPADAQTQPVVAQTPAGGSAHKNYGGKKSKKSSTGGKAKKSKKNQKKQKK